MSPDKYYHIVGVWDKPNGKLLLYLNGVLEGTNNNNCSGNFRFPNASEYLIGIGADQAGGITPESDNGFAGRFVIGRIYDKILTANEVLKLYSSVMR